MKKKPEKTALSPRDVATHLLKAGVDEISAAAELLTDDATERDLKRAIHEAAQGVELIVKSLVAQVHWSQVFEEPGKASVAALQRGDFKSATIEACLDRLRGIALFDVVDADRGRLAALRKKRNALEHFGFMENAQALRASVGAALNVLVELMTNAAEDGLLGRDGATARTELAKQLAQFDKFVAARMKKIKKRLAEAERFECPACLQTTAKISAGLECEFCLTHTDASEAADHYVENTLGRSQYQTVKDGGLWPVFGCSSCGEDALVQVDETADDRGFLCFGCAEEWAGNTLQPCFRCGRMVAAEGMAMCDECFSEKVASD